MAKRHRWVKLRTHVYICRACGTGKVNEQDRNGLWHATWHTPDGRSTVSPFTPPCEPGPKTARWLEHYRSALIVDGGRPRGDEQPRLV